MEGVRKDGVLVSARKILNFIQGNGMTITIADSGSGQNVIDITLASEAAAGGAPSGPAGGDLSGTYPNPDVVDDSHSHTTATAPGNLLHDSLANVFADQHHAESHTQAQHSKAVTGDISNVGATADGGVANAGVPRSDHVHGHGQLGGSVANAHAHSDLSGATATDHHPAPAAGPDADSAIDGTGATGTAATFARSGHGHKVATTDAPSGAVISIDAAASAAATGAIARAAHGHRMNTSANAPAAIGTAAAGTSGNSPSRDNHVHATGAGTPSTQAFGDAAATGSGPAASMTDHKHAMPALGTTTQAVGTAAGGSAVTPSKSDHVHATGAGTPSTQAFGDAAAVGSGPAAAMTDHKHAMPSERAAASTAPAAVGTAAVGTGVTDARADHVHATGAGTPSTQAFGDAAAVGSGPAASMTDHKHAMPAATVTRTLWVPGALEAVALDTGTSTPIGTAPDIIAAVALADAATQGFHFTIATPNDWSSGAITYTIYWSPGASDAVAHTVRWSTDVLKLVTGTTTVLAAGTTTAFTGGSLARVVNVLYTEAAQTLYTPTSAGELVRCDIRRVGADAADTYVGVVRVHGVLLSYTATR